MFCLGKYRAFRYGLELTYKQKDFLYSAKEDSSKQEVLPYYLGLDERMYKKQEAGVTHSFIKHHTKALFHSLFYSYWNITDDMPYD